MRIISPIFHCIALFLASVCGAYVALINYPWLTESMRTIVRQQEPSLVLDDQGREIMRFQLHKRAPVPLSAIPPIVIAAFLATEDRQFYQHPGISLWGIFRSLAHNIYHQRFAQGASTITQQLVRLLFFDTRKTIWRKIKEQLLALVIEHQMTKDQILETYLNHVYLGCGIYGIAAAAEQFWGTNVETLGIQEAAIIAGIVQSPRKYCPLLNPDQTLKRRNVVLTCMEQAGYLSSHERIQLTQEPLALHRGTSSPEASHLKNMIRKELEPLVGKQLLYGGGLKIRTTINQEMQQLAETIFSRSLDIIHAQRELATVDGALVTLAAQTGAIKAIVGGYSFEHSQFNRATQALRQIGSGLKPLLYATALEAGYALHDVVVDEPLILHKHGRTWEPSNVTRTFEGPMTRARALMISNNIVTIKTLQELTPAIFCTKLSRIETLHVQPLLSLALGCVDMTPLMAASLFNTLNNQGIWVKPFLIDSVKDQTGTRIWSHTSTTTPLFSWSTVSMINILLEQALDRWITHKAHLAPLPTAGMGKTGTTNDARSCWYLGATPSYTTAVYLGSDDYRILPHMYAVRSAQPLWYHYAQAYHDPHAKFSYDPALIERIRDGITGELVDAHHPRGIRVLEHAP